MSSRGVAKLSISVSRDLAKSVRKRVGARGVSGFAARALRHELQRLQLGDYLAQLDRELGPVPEEIVEEARRAWQKS